MSKVELVFKYYPEDCDYSESVDIKVNGAIVEVGSYGGCPEDNSRNRDYRWVEDAIIKVAEALGAEVEIKRGTCDECEYISEGKCVYCGACTL